MRLRRAHGFTLIELLVVIAMIAVMAAIMFPVLAQVREAGRRASCQSNQLQVAKALLMYGDNYDERLPGSAVKGVRADFSGDPRFADWGEAFWVEAVLPYVKSRDVFRCPSGPPASSAGRRARGCRSTSATTSTWPIPSGS